MDFKELSEYYQKIENSSKRLDKIEIVSNLLKKNKDNIEVLLLLLQGKVFSSIDKEDFGVSTKSVLKIMALSSGTSQEEINNLWRKIGDLGEVAEKIFSKKSQNTLFSSKLTVEKVFSNLKNLPNLSGESSTDQKSRYVSELLSNASGLEAKYIVRLVLSDLRIGLGSGTLRDSIAWAFLLKEKDYQYVNSELIVDDRESYNNNIKSLDRAYNLTNDFTIVAKAAINGTLKELNIQLFKPIKVMLGPKMKNAEEALESVSIPAMAEYKYDGFRMQVHKNKDEVRLFTRRLEEVTERFPDVIEYIKTHVKADSIILDSEAVGYNKETGEYLPFQKISQRIKRKHNISEISKNFPVELNVFDIIFYKGESCIEKEFQERRSLLKKVITEEKTKIVVSKGVLVNTKEELNIFYEKALSDGLEGVMVKKLNAPYSPGSRVGSMVKLKPVMETLDLVIISGEWGQGKRSGWITSFELACKSGDKFLSMGKVGTGLKEKSEDFLTFETVTELLRPLIIKEIGRNLEFKPEVIIEIAFEEIQKSPSYKSGYALRFPRVKRLRSNEKGLNDVSSLEYVKVLYEEQI